MANFLGYFPDAEAIMAEEQVLPNATTGTSTNEVRGVAGTRIVLIAATTITVATGEALSIELKGDLTNGGTPAPVMGDADAHMYLMHKTSADGELVYAANTVIGEWGVTQDMLDKVGPWLSLAYSTDGDLSAMKLTAFIDQYQIG